MCCPKQETCFVSSMQKDKAYLLKTKIQSSQKTTLYFGRSEEARTPDILLPKQARYQLRYTPIFCLKDVRVSKPLKFWASTVLVPVTGVEPVRYRYHWILSPARLPIPSHRQISLIHYIIKFYKNQYKFEKIF